MGCSSEISYGEIENILKTAGNITPPAKFKIQKSWKTKLLDAQKKLDNITKYTLKSSR